MKRYPMVLDEVETLRQVVAGRSIARYGDGEFKMCRGAGIKSQQFHPGLQGRLRGILQVAGQNPQCLIGIPNIRAATPKAAFWNKYMATAPLLGDGQYASAFITRPDSAPWINTPAYWALLESLWRDQEITLVRGSGGKCLTPDDLGSASVIHEIVGPRQHAFAEYDRLIERVLATTPRRVLVCLGPTATVMAVDLCAQGIHAIDLGHVALFLRKFRRGEPMVVTEEDKCLTQ